MDEVPPPLRILVVDDEPAVLEAYRHVLAHAPPESERDELLATLESSLFGETARPVTASGFALTLCRQGDEAVREVEAALAQEAPFAVAFLDVRMPPGLDGLQTGEQIRVLDPDLRLVFVTAHSDYEPEEMTERLGGPDQFFYLQKPLRPRELRQSASALGARWLAERSLQAQRAQLQAANEHLREEIAARQQSEQRLREAVSLYEATADSVFAELLVLDQDLRVVFCNGPASRAFAGEGGELVGRLLQEVLPAPLLEATGVLGRLDRLSQTGGRDQASNVRVPQREGRDRYLDLRLRAFEARGDEKRVLVIIEDVTERHRLQEQVQAAARQESVALLAGGVAHEFNNLLTAISGYCDLVGLSLGNPARAREYLDHVRAGVKRGGQLTEQLLAFSCRQPLELRAFDLAVGARRASEMVQRLLGEGIELRLQLQDDLPAVMVDPPLLGQAMLNIATNAGEAMPEGGVLTISTRAVPAGAQELRTVPGLAEVPCVALAVSDTGVGMDARTLERVFEPFFSTKGVGEGTGLGLAMVYGFVREHGGHITAHSEPGHGSTFTIYLPQADGSAEPWPPPPPASPAERSKGGSILLVEDVEAVREALATALTAAGYDVTAAASPREALGIAGGASCPDLLITDVVMPGMSGFDLYEDLVSKHPLLRAVFMSAYSDEITRRGHAALEGMPLLRKPFECAELIATIRQTLE